MPVARHLALHYPDDPNVYALSFEEYLLGEDLLVAPISEPGANQTKVYVPEGTWCMSLPGRASPRARAVCVSMSKRRLASR